MGAAPREGPPHQRGPADSQVIRDPSGRPALSSGDHPAHLGDGWWSHLWWSTNQQLYVAGSVCRSRSSAGPSKGATPQPVQLLPSQMPVVQMYLALVWARQMKTAPADGRAEQVRDAVYDRLAGRWRLCLTWPRMEWVARVVAAPGHRSGRRGPPVCPRPRHHPRTGGRPVRQPDDRVVGLAGGCPARRGLPCLTR